MTTKKLSIVVVLFLGFLAALFFYALPKVEAQTACNPSKVKTIILPTTVPTLTGVSEEVEVLKFRLKNENTATTCNFTFKNLKVQELFSYTGSSISDLQLMHNGANLSNELSTEKFGRELVHTLQGANDIGLMTVVVPAGSQKDFSIINHEFADPVGDHGDSFAVGIEYINGDFANGTVVNNWYGPIKWGPIMYVQQ